MTGYSLPATFRGTRQHTSGHFPPADRYEIKHTGPYNYKVSAGDVDLRIDGYRGSTILEAKHVDKPHSSPYVPGSSCPKTVRASVLEGTRKELRKAQDYQ